MFHIHCIHSSIHLFASCSSAIICPLLIAQPASQDQPVWQEPCNTDRAVALLTVALPTLAVCYLGMGCHSIAGWLEQVREYDILTLDPSWELQPVRNYHYVVFSVKNSSVLSIVQ